MGFVRSKRDSRLVVDVPIERKEGLTVFAVFGLAGWLTGGDEVLTSASGLAGRNGGLTRSSGDMLAGSDSGSTLTCGLDAFEKPRHGNSAFPSSPSGPDGVLSLSAVVRLAVSWRASGVALVGREEGFSHRLVANEAARGLVFVQAGPMTYEQMRCVV